MHDLSFSFKIQKHKNMISSSYDGILHGKAECLREVYESSSTLKGKRKECIHEAGDAWDYVA